jgi:hypothetical protein
MAYTRRGVTGAALALFAPLTGCSRQTGRGGQVDVTIVDASAEEVDGAPPYEESPVSEVEVIEETVEEVRKQYDPKDERERTATVLNEQELRRASDAMQKSDPASGEELGSYFAGDGVYIVVLLKQYS